MRFQFTPLKPFLLVMGALVPAAHAIDERPDTSGQIQTLASLDESVSQLENSATMPVILTTTRLNQPQTEVPGSVTVIDREMIELIGAREIPELLRLVPGMAVANIDGNVPTVSYHATVSRDIKRMQVLIDGRSIYQPALSRVLWDDIPITVDDIERIEVTRGPNSAAYGPNSFSAIINIMTKHPNDTQGAKARVTKGNNGINDFFVRGGMKLGDLSFRVGAFGRSDNGYDRNEDETWRRDAKDIKGFSLNSRYQVDADNEAEFHMGYKEGEAEQDWLDGWEFFGKNLEKPRFESDNGFGMFKWKTRFSEQHSISIQLVAQESNFDNDRRTCLTTPNGETNLAFTHELFELREAYKQNVSSNKSYEQALVFALQAEAITEQTVTALSGETPETMTSSLQDTFTNILERDLIAEETAVLDRAVNMALANDGEIPVMCGVIDDNLKEERIDFEVVNNFTLSDQVRMVIGFGAKEDKASSLYYLNGSASNSSYRLFSHVEYRPVRELVFNLGGHYEEDDIMDGEFSPRVAMNLNLDEHQSIRLVYSKATRSIDTYEKNAAPRIYLNNINEPYASNTFDLLGQDHATFYIREDIDKTMKSEKIESREFGYYAYFNNQFEMDFRLFEERLTDLFAEALNIVSFEANNKSWVQLDGYEVQAKWRVDKKNLVVLAMAHIDNTPSTKTENRLSADDSGSLMWNHQYAEGFNFNLAYHHANRYNEPNSDGGYKFSRADVGMSGIFKVLSTRLKLSGKVMVRLNNKPLGNSDNNYDDDEIYFLTAEMEI